MPLPTFKTAEEIPEAFRPEYEERDGEWHPKVVAADDLAAERKKRARLLDEKREEERLRKEAETRLATLEREREAHDNKVPEETLKRWQTEAEAKEEAHKKAMAEKDAQIIKLTLTDRVQALYLAHGGMSDRVEDAMYTLAKRSDLGDAGGIVFKDKEGNVTTDTPEAFFRKLKVEKPWLFIGTGASGSGAGGSTGTGGDLTAEAQQRITDQKRVQVAGAF